MKKEKVIKEEFLVVKLLDDTGKLVSKHCGRCKEYKQEDEFSKNVSAADGHQAACIKCRRESYAADMKKKREVIDYDNLDYTELRNCTTCNKDIPLSGYDRKISGKDGFALVCKSCSRIAEAAFTDRCIAIVAVSNFCESDIKVCERCKISKTRADFYDNKGHPEGKDPTCKQCRKSDVEEIINFNEANPHTEDYLLNNSKVCTLCNTDKIFKEYPYRSGLTGGLSPSCIDCNRNRNEITREHNKVIAAKIPEDYSKECNRCFDEKSKDDFGVNNSSKDGLATICKDCEFDIRNEIKTLNEERRNNGYFESDISFDCCGCGENKHISFFNRSDNSIRGVVYYCMDCMRQKRINNIDDRKEYVKNNGLQINAQVSQKRDYKNQFEPILQKDLEDLLDRYEHKCAYCEIEVRQRDNLHMDHIVPLKLGGPHTIENLAPACKTCNLEKGAMTKEEFLIKRALRQMYKK